MEERRGKLIRFEERWDVVVPQAIHSMVVTGKEEIHHIVVVLVDERRLHPLWVKIAAGDAGDPAAERGPGPQFEFLRQKIGDGRRSGRPDEGIEVAN